MTTTLQKLGLPNISEMSDEELRKLISSDRQHRVLVRTAGRIKRIQKDEKAPKSHKVATLESVGLDPQLVIAIRTKNPGKSDAEIIAVLKSRGIL